MPSVRIPNPHDQERRQALPGRVPARRPRVDRAATAARSRRAALALARRAWIIGELAALRVPDVRLLDRGRLGAADAARRGRPLEGEPCRRRRLDARAAPRRARPRAADPRRQARRHDHRRRHRRPHRAAPRGREEARNDLAKASSTSRSVLDYANLDTNPVRDTQRQAAARGKRRARAADPPSTSRPSTGRFPPFTGSRCCGSTGRALASAAVDTTRVGDYDETRRRIRLRKSTTKSRHALWVDVPGDARRRHQRDARRRARIATPTRGCSPQSGSNALRTAIAQACRALAIPLWSPHDLRHRRDVAAAPARPLLGRDRLVSSGSGSSSITADTYTHVLARRPRGRLSRRCSRQRPVACETCDTCWRREALQ